MHVQKLRSFRELLAALRNGWFQKFNEALHRYGFHVFAISFKLDVSDYKDLCWCSMAVLGILDDMYHFVPSYDFPLHSSAIVPHVL